MRWQIEWRGHKFTEDNLTVAHLAVVCGLVEDSWSVGPEIGPMRLVAHIAAWVMFAERRPLNDVMLELNAASISELAEALIDLDALEPAGSEDGDDADGDREDDVPAEP